MKMKLEGDTLIMIEVDTYTYNIIKSWNATRYNRQRHCIEGTVTADLLNKLARLVRLPEPIEARRRSLNAVVDAVNKERLREEPIALYKYPVKSELFKHQTRGANMALLTFGLISPEKEDEVYGRSSKDVESGLPQDQRLQQ
jgi:hypothetical protein